jgi:hypothetical protein
MNTSNAFGFLALGWVMKTLPIWAPHRFPPTGIDGSNAQAIWLYAMGWIEVAVGVGYLFQHSLKPAFLAWAAFRLPPGALGLPQAIPVRV